MSLRSRPLGVLIVMLIVGSVLGSLFCELLGVILPNGVIRDFFVKGFEPHFGPLDVNLGVIGFTIGLGLKVTIASVLGIMLAIHLFRWY